MAFDLLDSISVPGDPAKPNEDAFAVEKDAAVVFDGATGLGENLLPGASDAAWIAHFGARRLLAHGRDGDAPKENYEIPFASMMFVVADESGFEALWFGDCAALVLRPGTPLEIVGEAFDKRAAESRGVKKLAQAKNLAPTAGLSRAEYLPHLRASRNKVNSKTGSWLFAPDPHAADHVASKRIEVPSGTLVLLSTDGFLALASDYGAYDAMGLIVAARDKGLKTLSNELRALEAGDAEGRLFPRLKKSDDATAVLLRLA